MNGNFPYIFDCWANPVVNIILGAKKLHALTQLQNGFLVFGSIGKAVASKTRGPRFESNHRKSFY